MEDFYFSDTASCSTIATITLPQHYTIKTSEQCDKFNTDVNAQVIPSASSFTKFFFCIFVILL